MLPLALAIIIGAPQDTGSGFVFTPPRRGEGTFERRDFTKWSATAETTGSGARIELQSPTEEFWISVGAFGRVSWPFGALEDRDVILSGNTILIPDHLRYADLFDVGTGFSLEASLMIFRPPPQRLGAYGQALPRGPYAGFYVALQSDSYEGDRISDGSAFIEPDDLDVATVLFGLKVTTDVDAGVWGEMRLGVGVVRYEAVNARVSLNGGGVESQELLDDSQEIAAEFRFRFSARLGPLGLVGGMGLRLMGSPEEGDSTLGDAVDPEAFWSYDADLGFEIGF